LKQKYFSKFSLKAIFEPLRYAVKNEEPFFEIIDFQKIPSILFRYIPFKEIFNKYLNNVYSHMIIKVKVLKN
jgi:hypothetical protein